MQGLLLFKHQVVDVLRRQKVVGRTLGRAATQGVGPATSPVLQINLGVAGGPENGGLLFNEVVCSDTVKDTFIGWVRVLPVLWLLRVEQQVTTCLLLLLVHVILE